MFTLQQNRLLKYFWVAITIFTFVGCEQQISTVPPPNLEIAKRLRQALEDAGGGEATGEVAVSTASPTGFATFKGQVVIKGKPPENKPINVSRDTDICGASARDLQLVVHPDQDGGGIQNVLFFAEGVPEAWLHPSSHGYSEDFVFDQKKCVFLTRVVGFQVSQRFKIINSDPVGHNTALSPRMNASFDQTIPAGSVAYYQAETEEKVPVSVKCAVHPWMQAWMIPRNNGYFAVTDQDGNFEIPNLPAGVEITFRAWHEIPKFIGSVNVDGEDKKWKKGKFNLTLQPDESKVVRVTIEASEFE